MRFGYVSRRDKFEIVKIITHMNVQGSKKREKSKNRLDILKRYTKITGLRIDRIGGRVLSEFGTRVADFGLSRR